MTNIRVFAKKKIFAFSNYNTQDSCLRLAKSLSAKVGVPLQGNGKFARGAYYVAGCLLRPIVLTPMINKYIVQSQSFSNSLNHNSISCLDRALAAPSCWLWQLLEVSQGSSSVLGAAVVNLAWHGRMTASPGRTRCTLYAAVYTDCTAVQWTGRGESGSDQSV